ncbi:kinase-like protein [Aspergillus pseudonomiae]|uniref:Kinase-like protein n=1 Tax=Aspergillus pseudonomiae TaxID=1506151 RepID=A0A5N7DJ13_9EURO|nr:kinase-like protein [Aspergillus pseudonomiae]KAE8406430.1 kinase-like protein [Aspergillus pseudonomiae]
MDSQAGEAISDPTPKLRTYFCASNFLIPDLDHVKKQCTGENKKVHWAGVTIVRISSMVVVKFGTRVTVTEAKSIIYVAQNSKVPVPEVFACCTYGPIDREIEDYDSLFDTYIFMSFVDGQTLDTVWNNFDQLTKRRIASRLKEYIDNLRSMGSMSYIGSVDHGPVTDSIFATCKVQGPFGFEKEFNEAIVDAYYRTVSRQHIQKFLSGMIGHKERRILFAHAVEMQNDWGDYLLDILQPYYNEYAFYSFVS